MKPNEDFWSSKYLRDTCAARNYYCYICDFLKLFEICQKSSLGRSSPENNILVCILIFFFLCLLGSSSLNIYSITVPVLFSLYEEKMGVVRIHVGSRYSLGPPPPSFLLALTPNRSDKSGKSINYSAIQLF